MSQQKLTLAPAHTGFREIAENIESHIASGKLLAKTSRNTLTKITVNNDEFVVKAFGKPGKMRAFIYRWLARPKAQKSFEHATRLKALGFETPEPIAHIEVTSPLQLSASYYICRYCPHEKTMEEVLHTFSGDSDAADLIRAFTEFTYKLHEAGVLHVDHNAGNTLINFHNAQPRFSLIDLNRMQFGPLSLSSRLGNFLRLTDNISAMQLIGEHYAECVGEDPTICTDKLLALKQRHWKKIAVKRALKQLVGRGDRQ